MDHRLRCGQNLTSLSSCKPRRIPERLGPVTELFEQPLEVSPDLWVCHTREGLFYVRS